MNVSVSHLEQGADLSAAFAIRKQVFNGEDGIPTDADFDGKDDIAEQFLAYDGLQVIGTARYRLLDDGWGKVERVAVVPEYRGRGVGKAIMGAIHESARRQGIARLILNSKVSSMGLYAKLGYQAEGEEFEDVGLPHIKMVLDLSVE